MKSRGLVVAIAVVLAVLAAVGVIVYTSSVRDTAITEGTTPVIASSQDIPSGTQLDPLIASNVFKTINVREPGSGAGRRDGYHATARSDDLGADLPERADPREPRREPGSPTTSASRRATSGSGCRSTARPP